MKSHPSDPEPYAAFPREAGLRVEAVTGADGSPTASDVVDADFTLQAV